MWSQYHAGSRSLYTIIISLPNATGDGDYGMYSATRTILRRGLPVCSSLIKMSLLSWSSCQAPRQRSSCLASLVPDVSARTKYICNHVVRNDSCRYLAFAMRLHRLQLSLATSRANVRGRIPPPSALVKDILMSAWSYRTPP